MTRDGVLGSEDFSARVDPMLSDLLSCTWEKTAHRQRCSLLHGSLSREMPEGVMLTILFSVLLSGAPRSLRIPEPSGCLMN